MADDLDGLVRLLHEREVRRYLCDDTILPCETVAAMLAQSEQLEPHGLGLWVIEPALDGFAGIAGLQPVSAEAGAAPAMAGGVEPLIALDPKHWGQGPRPGPRTGAVHLAARESRRNDMTRVPRPPRPPYLLWRAGPGRVKQGAASLARESRSTGRRV